MTTTNSGLAPSPGHRLIRSTSNRMVAGVCSGIADYFDIDPTLVRALYAVLTVITGIVPGVIVYVALMLIMPKQT